MHLAWHRVTDLKKPHKDMVLCGANPGWRTFGKDRKYMCVMKCVCECHYVGVCSYSSVGSVFSSGKKKEEK